MVKKTAAFAIVVVLVALVLAVNVAPAGAVAPAGLTPTVEPPTFTPTATATNTPLPPTPTNTPPPSPTKTPEPTPTPKWDKSSIEVKGKCVDGESTFVIKNGGDDMAGPSRYWWVNGHASASTCDEIPEDPTLGGGDFQLLSGQSLVVTFPVGNLAPPFSICVAQRPGHPGTGYASASLDASDKCPTAEDVVAEPMGSKRLFLPLMQGR